MKPSLPALCVLFLTTGISCSGGGERESARHGRIQVRITETPTDVACIRLIGSGSSQFVADTDVEPGQSSIIDIQRVPVGSIQLSGEAFSTECDLTESDAVPNWTGGPEQAIVRPGQVATVNLRMRRSGDVSVEVDFEDDEDLCASVTCDDGDACTVDTCDPTTGTCTFEPSICECTGQAELRLINYLGWCSVSINGDPATTSETMTTCVDPGNVLLSASPTAGFILGDWHGTANDTGAGDPGTISGDTSTTTVTMAEGQEACVWVCCPVSDGSGCPSEDQCAI